MYYPLSQITTNLNTNGGELIYANTRQDYIGYYYKTSKGEYFTGKTPQDGPNELLIQEIVPAIYTDASNPTSSVAYVNVESSDVIVYVSYLYFYDTKKEK